MKFYDFYNKLSHPKWVVYYLIKANQSLINFLLKERKDNEIRILEIGPGRGYFYEAIKLIKNRKIFYFAIDQNKQILKKLKINNCANLIQRELPAC